MLANMLISQDLSEERSSKCPIQGTLVPYFTTFSLWKAGVPLESRVLQWVLQSHSDQSDHNECIRRKNGVQYLF